MLQFLKSSFMLAIIAGLLITIISVIDSKINKTSKSKSEYVRLFIISSIVVYCLLPFYHVPKAILKEIIDTNPPKF